MRLNLDIIHPSIYNTQLTAYRWNDDLNQWEYWYYGWNKSNLYEIHDKYSEYIKQNKAVVKYVSYESTWAEPIAEKIK